MRRKLTQDVGFLIPSVHIRDNLELPANGYRVLVHGVPVATAEIHPDRELALDPGSALGTLEGIAGKDPRSAWMPPGSSRTSAPRPKRWATPWSIRPPWSPPTSHLIREHAAGHEEVQHLLANLAKSAPKLVEDLTPKALPLSAVVRVLQNLLVERIPIRQLRKIAEALVEHAPSSQDPC